MWGFKLNIKVVPNVTTSTALSWYSSDSNSQITLMDGSICGKTYGSVTLTAETGNFRKSLLV